MGARKHFRAIAAMCLACAMPSAASARELYRRPPDGIPPIAQAVVVDRAPEGDERWGTWVEGNSVSVDGSRPPIAVAIMAGPSLGLAALGAAGEI